MIDDYDRDLEAVERKGKKAAKNKQDDIDEAYREVMSTGPGRRVLWDIMSELGLMQNPFSAGSPDITAFNCGRHNEAIKLLVRLNTVDPANALLMQEEASK